MTDLLTRLQDATEETQWAAIHCVLARAHRLGWITTETFVTAKEWGQSGAFVAAALTLVPEGHEWTISYDPSDDESTAEILAQNWVGGPETGGTYRPGPEVVLKGNRPALALCIASLRARDDKAEVA